MLGGVCISKVQNILVYTRQRVGFKKRFSLQRLLSVAPVLGPHRGAGRTRGGCGGRSESVHIAAHPCAPAPARSQHGRAQARGDERARRAPGRLLHRGDVRAHSKVLPALPVCLFLSYYLERVEVLLHCISTRVSSEGGRWSPTGTLAFSHSSSGEEG